jgi:CDGSH-type Zn-finger protein
MKKIIITKNGPYKVIGNIPINEIIIKQEATGNKYELGRTFEAKEEYYLCRCGKSRNAPFCDGTHIREGFEEELVAVTKKSSDDYVTYEGKNIILHDEEKLCAFARFCHNNKSDVWSSTENDELEEAKNFACNCPSGRLHLKDKKTNEEFKNDYKDEISIIQDPSKRCSGPIWVKGNISVEDEDGNVYEKGNSVTLCRCGNSNNKPFCDARHVPSKYNDGLGINK